MADGTQKGFGFPDIPPTRLRPGEIVVDLFAGGGGASVALEAALRRQVDIAINHDEFAVGMHAANHPLTRHLREDVWIADPLELRRLIELSPFSREEFELSYEPTEDPLEQARRTVLRSFQGFGSAAACGEVSGFRANSSRSHTTPAHDWRNYPEAFVTIIERLRGVVIENRDAYAVMERHDSPHCLHYVDPPYVHSTRSSKVRKKVHSYDTRKSYRFELTDEQHADLARFLKDLRGMVVLSGYPSELYDSLYADWTRIDRQSMADGAQPRIECLWLNDAAEAALPSRQNRLALGAA